MSRVRADEGGRLTGDGGLALPLIAVMMLVLLAFVAFAVDVGAAYAVRRQSQAAADSAVMGAAQQILNGGTRAHAASYAKELSHDSVALDPAETDWEAAFASCNDSSALAVTAPTGGDTSIWAGQGPTGCVSFSANNKRVRVRIPSQVVDAAFAQLVGVETFNISTSAEAIIDFTASGGGALPYAIPGNSAAFEEVCLNSGGGNLPPGVCEGSTTGNFGPVDWSIFGATDTTVWLGSGATASVTFATGCSTSSSPYGANERLALNNMLGVDHPLSVVPELGNSGIYDASEIRDDQTLCNASSPPNWLARPNQAPLQPGNNQTNWQGGTNVGLILGTTLDNGTVLRGRLDRFCGDPGPTCVKLYGSSGAHGTNSRGIAGAPVDDTPLWDFLSTDLVQGSPATGSPRADGTYRSVPAECLPSAFTNDPVKADLMACFAAYIAGGYGNVVNPNGTVGTVLFGKDTDGDSLNGLWDIMKAPRFGFVPLLWNPELVNGSSDPVQVREFRPVYFQTMLFGCNNNRCETYNPGEEWTPMNGGGGNQLDAVSALAIKLPMLPVEARDVAPAGKSDLRITLVR